MSEQLRHDKAIIRSYMRERYTDARLVMLLDHARSGKLAYRSCCCFIGITTADHELRGFMPFNPDLIEQEYPGLHQHYQDALARIDEEDNDNPENAYHRLGETDAMRICRLVPMILAEIKRRRMAGTDMLPEILEATVAE